MDFTDPHVLTPTSDWGSEVPVPKNPSEAQAEPPKRETKESRLHAIWEFPNIRGTFFYFGNRIIRILITI